MFDPGMHLNANEKLRLLPPDFHQELLPDIRNEFLKINKTIVVLDDDPTGTQTCSEVTVLTSWGTKEIAEELKTKPSILFILTNSRSLPEEEATALAYKIGHHLKEAIKESGREMMVISRSDSTLRGHFPAEVDALTGAMDRSEASRVLIPAFIEGGRYTIDDVHYLLDNEVLIPVSETPFAKDLVFGYSQSNLKLWVEEKTKGRVKASDVISISLTDLRTGGPSQVVEKLNTINAGGVFVVNAVSYRDLEVLALGMLLAQKEGRNLVFRSSASFVSILAGQEPGKPFIPKFSDVGAGHGSLIVVGSHVPKSTLQLKTLLAQGIHRSIEINVKVILNESDTNSMTSQISNQIDRWLASDYEVIIYTSRQLESGAEPSDNLRISARVSDYLVEIIAGLRVRPRFIIAKGGITSSDLATKALKSNRARVLGPIIPGVPVWQLDPGSKFPGLIYVVFPGNVGGEEALVEVLEKLK